MGNHPGRELVISVPLPEDRGRHGDGRPKTHRFRSHWLELGRRLRDFRGRYGLTQDEVARVVGARHGSAVTQWEYGVNVPEGLRRERLIELVEGRLWPDLRASVIDGDGMPSRWSQGVRWYRRASRERVPREGIGAVVAAVLDDLQVLNSPDALRRRYAERDGEWVYRIAAQLGLGEAYRADLRRSEDAAYGLRWFELAQRSRFDLRRSLVPQLPLALLEAEPGDERADG